MLIAIVAALIGVAAGFAIDAAAVRFVRAWYDEGALDEYDSDADDAVPVRGPLPRALTSWALPRRVLTVTAAIALFAALGGRYQDNLGYVAIALAYGAVLLLATETDLITRFISDRVTYPAIALAFVLGFALPDANTTDVVVGGLVAGGLLLLFSLLPQGGLADAKLGLFMGLALGVQHIASALLIMAILGGVVSVGILIGTKMRARGTPIPYGPFIAAGMVAAMLIEGTAFRSF